MAATLEVGRITLGSGIPKIIVPIVGRSEDDILRAAQEIAAHPHVDLAEWRADHYENALDAEKTCQLLTKLQSTLQDKPLLYTFRTAREGGQVAIAAPQYITLCETVAQSGMVHLIDVEMFYEEAAQECVSRIHAHGIPIVGSWHHFTCTPPCEELLARFHMMQQSGADVLKIAVMPQCEEDVLALMSAARQMHEIFANRPLTAMSMGELGRISRTAGETFGACMTFGMLGAASAPGQVDVDTLHAQICALHESLQQC